MPFDMSEDDPWWGSHPQFGDKIEATVKIRRVDGWPVKPEGDAIDGARVQLQYAWHIVRGDHSLYQGEVAWMPTNQAMIDGTWPREWPSWIASGDLTDIVRL